MKYFIIAGEASGDLHASNLMRELKKRDPNAEFSFLGGDRMSREGGMCLCHYRNVAYMGFLPVFFHLRTIMRTMKLCRRFIMHLHPDVVILVDYPGFNLSIASFVRRHTDIPVYYYISPKIWAWKEYRIKEIRKNVDEMFSILPFEVPFFEEKHHYPIHYVGNPSVDEISVFKSHYHTGFPEFAEKYHLSQKPVIVLLPGSRRQEIKDNLFRMCAAAIPFLDKGYQIVVGGVSDISRDIYDKQIRRLQKLQGCEDYHVLEDCTNEILSNAEAALVTSGTATLETALFRVPQVVCYYTPCGSLFRRLKKKFLHVPYISLVNLIVDRELVPELIADEMTIPGMQLLLGEIVEGGVMRQHILDGYSEMTDKLGLEGAPARAAEIMLNQLQKQ